MDFGAYRTLTTPTTVASYQHFPGGPAPQEFTAAKQSKTACRDAVVEYPNHPVWSWNRMTPNRGADKSDFSEEELDVIEAVLVAFWEWNAQQISKRAKQDSGWRLTVEHEDIPYETDWVSPAPTTPKLMNMG